MDQQQRERNADHPACSRAEQHRAIRLASLRKREPVRDRVRRARQRARFARAKQKSRRDERTVAGGGAGQHRERRPPHDDPREHLPRTDDIGQPAGRNLEHRVGERKRAEHPRHLRVGQMQFVRDVGRCG